MFARAVRARSRGDLDAALRILVEALETAPSKARLWIEVADCQRDLAHGEEALRALRRAEKARPDSATVKLRIGIVQLERGRSDLALPALEGALKIEPSAVAHNLLFSALTQLGRGEEGRKHLERALKLDAKNGDAHCNLGVLLSDEHRFAEAERHLRRAIEIDGRDAVAHAEFGRVLLRRGRPADALPLLRRAIKLNPDAYWARLHLAEASAALRRYKAAEGAYREALQTRPADPCGYARYAEFLQSRGGRSDEAERQLQTALMLGPKNPDVNYAMGVHLLTRARDHLALAAEAGHARAQAHLRPFARS
jgi:tetratricopeptide (TPR) repeat protein